jgi:hypothetical protein
VGGRHALRESGCIPVKDTGCVSCDRLAAALAMRRPELWDSNPRLAERLEMRIQAAQRAHRDTHGSTSDTSRCLAERHPDIPTS